MIRVQRFCTAFIGLGMMMLPTAVAAQAAASPGNSAYITEPNRVDAANQMAILDVIARMNHAIDVNDYPLYASFYTDDGMIDSGFGPPSVGSAAIIATLQQSAPFITNKRHVIGNPVISGSNDKVKVTYYLVVYERQSGLNLAGTAVITDTLRRVNGTWRVATHTTRMDPATLAAMQAAMGAR